MAQQLDNALIQLMKGLGEAREKIAQCHASTNVATATTSASPTAKVAPETGADIVDAAVAIASPTAVESKEDGARDSAKTKDVPSILAAVAAAATDLAANVASSTNTPIVGADAVTIGTNVVDRPDNDAASDSVAPWSTRRFVTRNAALSAYKPFTVADMLAALALLPVDMLFGFDAVSPTCYTLSWTAPDLYASHMNASAPCATTACVVFTAFSKYDEVLIVPTAEPYPNPTQICKPLGVTAAWLHTQLAPLANVCPNAMVTAALAGPKQAGDCRMLDAGMFREVCTQRPVVPARGTPLLFIDTSANPRRWSPYEEFVSAVTLAEKSPTVAEVAHMYEAMCTRGIDQEASYWPKDGVETMKSTYQDDRYALYHLLGRWYTFPALCANYDCLMALRTDPLRNLWQQVMFERVVTPHGLNIYRALEEDKGVVRGKNVRDTLSQMDAIMMREYGRRVSIVTVDKTSQMMLSPVCKFVRPATAAPLDEAAQKLVTDVLAAVTAPK